MRWLIGSLGSIVWSTVVFAIGMMFFFPGEWVKEQIAYQVQTQSKKKLLVNIEEAKSSGLFGVELQGVSLFESKRGKRTPGQTATPPRENTLMGSLDAISISPSMLSLFAGRVATDLEVSLAGGDIETSFGMDSSSWFLGSDIEGFQLDAHPIEAEDLTVELSGLLNLESDLAFNRDDIKSSTGNISLTVDNLALKKATISGFDLDATTFSEAVLEMEVEGGKAKVTKGSFVGDLIEATIEGHITLRKDISRSRLSLKFLIRFDETLDKLAMMMLKSARDDDGVYHFKGQGTLMNPRFRADRVSRRSSSSGSDSTFSKDDDVDEVERPTRPRRRSSVTDEEREERRAKRRDRLKKRRERMKKRREDRRERQRGGGDDDFARDAGTRDRYDDEEAASSYTPPPAYEEEVEPEYNNNNNNNNNNDYNNANDPQYNNDPQYQGNDAQYGEANDPNGNMEDLGYIDE